MLAATAKDRGIYIDTIDDDFINLITTAAPLHDIGKITIPDCILLKPARLTVDEFEIIKTHTTEGGKMIHQVLGDSSDKDYVSIAYDVAMFHHEKWDGSGYPMGLKGEGIPVSARIMAICDVYDALIMERCYKKPFSKDEALKIIKDGAGTHFDPILAKLFVEIIIAINKNNV